MNLIRRVFVVLALFLALGATPALADKPVLQLQGSNPTLAFDPTSPTTASYVFTNSGTGTLRAEQVTWTYEERGTVDFTNSAQVVDSASYAIVQVKGKKEKTTVFDVDPGTYQVEYTGPGPIPCTTGTFSARLKQGAFVQGTFDCVNGVPSASMDFTIERGSNAEKALAG